MNAPAKARGLGFLVSLVRPHEFRTLLMKNFLSQYGAATQVLGSAAFVLLVAWAGGHIKSKVIGDWTYSRYPMVGKTVAVLSAAFVTAAIIYNGGELFEEDWWVPPAFLIMTICFYLNRPGF